MSVGFLGLGAGGRGAGTRRRGVRLLLAVAALSGAWAVLGSAQALAAGDATETKVSCGATVEVGAPAKCAATVRDMAAAKVPTGVVAFNSTLPGPFKESPCTLKVISSSEADCEVEYVASKAGSAKVAAEYEGDTEHEKSKGEATLSVTKRKVSVIMSCSPGAVVIAQTAVCEAKVADTGQGTKTAPTGSVTFKTDSVGTFVPEPPKCTLQAVVGQEHETACKVEYIPAKAGSPKLTAEYEPADAEHEAGNKPTTTLTVTKRVTATTVACDPVTLGLWTVCTATATDMSAGTASPPTGSVTFTAEHEAKATGAFTPVPACTLTPVAATESACTVKYTPTAAGPNTIAAAYPGDEKHEPAHSEQVLVVSGRPTTLTWTCPAGATVAHPLTCTATASDTATGPKSTPTGMVTFSGEPEGTFSSKACELKPVAGKEDEATCSIEYTPTAAATGGDKVTAAYQGDGAHAPEAATVVIAVAEAPKTTVGGTTTTTTTTTTPTKTVNLVPTPPSCRLVGKEQWRKPAGKRKAKAKPVLSFTYTCNQDASVAIEATVKTTRRQGTKKKTQTATLTPVSSAATAGKEAPVLVMALPSSVATALNSGVRPVASITFRVRNANGTGVAKLKLTLVHR